MARSSIKNTGQALDIDAGSFEITKVDFINNLGASGVSRIARVLHTGIFTDCNFIHDSTMKHKEATSSPRFHFYSLFDFGITEEEDPVVFDGCTFSNLLGADKPTYIYCTWHNWNGPNNQSIRGELKSLKKNIEFKNSVFTFKKDEAVGLFAGYGGTGSGSGDRLLVDNIRIIDNGSTTKLFWLDAATNSQQRFFFRDNSYYNDKIFTRDVFDSNGNLPATVPAYVYNNLFRITDKGRPTLVK
ncbi:MAG: hypothetical protein FWD91_06255 [Treponema sp.]|nr:hypothetical protein [Treponema sp.]